MAEGFSPRLEILPRSQRLLWEELATIPPEFVLYGGTAIALQLGHRESIDFDFFGSRPLDTENLLLAIPFLADAVVLQREANTLSCFVDRDGPVHLSFFGVPKIKRLQPPLAAPGNGLQIASLLDLAGAKARVIQRRAEAKDYIDMDALLTDGRIDLPMALASAIAVYGAQFNPQITLKALTYFDDGGLAQLPEAVKKRLVSAVRQVDLRHLPDVPELAAGQGRMP